MGLRDAFRSRRSEGNPDESGESGGGLQGIASDDVEITWFSPRTDGEYRNAGGPAGSADGLRFVPGGRVQYRPGDGATGPWTGEYTGAGRFSVQARFERPITFAVTEFGAESFTARRTDTRDRSAVTFTYRFTRPPAG